MSSVGFRYVEFSCVKFCYGCCVMFWNGMPGYVRLGRMCSVELR